jgi:hypothetical protein
LSAQFDHTTAGFKGSVAKRDDMEGKTASINMWTNSGHVEDILRLFISAKTAPDTGAFTFAGHVEPFLRRMKMSGNFEILGGKFAKTETERDLTRLSDSGKKRRENAAGQPPRDVRSTLKGHG